MSLDDRTRALLFDAGRDAVAHNAPLGPDRVVAIADFVAANAGDVVDLGCGTGNLILELADRHPDLRATGIDTDQAAIEQGMAASAARGLADRVRFVAGDLTEADPADVALCIGASHAFGDAGAMLAALVPLGRGAAVVGDGVWVAKPDQRHIELFGHLPQGEGELAERAEAAGWTVAAQSRSSMEEWDAFEHRWIDGVRRLGTTEATAFADLRLEEYEQLYRGVLGFGWLFLSR